MSQPNLEHGNELFHDAYGAATDDATRDVPVLVLFEDKLFARQGSTTKVRTVTTPAFDALKNATHVPIAAFALARGRAPRDVRAASGDLGDAASSLLRKRKLEQIR